MSDRQTSCAGVALALAFFSSMLSSSLPTPLYPVYISFYSFSASQITSIFGTYAAGVILSLLVTSRINIRTNLYTVPIYVGLICVLLSSLLMIFADSFIELILGRFITGLGTGIIMAYINRSLIKLFDTEVNNTAALTASASLILGQALGPLITGNIVFHKFYMLKLPYIILFILVVVSIFGIWFSRLLINGNGDIEAIEIKSAKNGTQQKIPVRDIIICYMSIFLSWSMASTFMSQGPTIARNYFNVTSVQLVSYSLSVFLIVAGITQIVMRKVYHYSSLKIGFFSQSAAILLVLYSVHTTTSSLLFISVIVEGFAYGAILVGSTAIINIIAKQSQRHYLINNLYIVGYLGNWLPFLLSEMMDHSLPRVALSGYFLLCIFLSLCITLLSYIFRKGHRI